MSSAIGRAALILTTNATGLRSGLNDVGQDARRWADNTANNVNSRLKDVGKDAGKGSGFKKLAVGAVAAVAGVVGVREAVQTLDEVARGGAAAKAFGLTAEQFTGMAAVARSTGELQREFIESLVTLGKVASEGASGKGEVATAWFKSLNLNAQDFKKLNLEEQFFSVFEAIQKVQDPAERVRAIMVAFGEDGGKFLLPLLAKAPGEIRAMAKSFAISGREVEKATAANAQLTQAGNTLKAGWRTIVIALAPAIGTIGKIITGMKPVFDVMGQAIEAISDIAGPAFDEIVSWIRGITTEVGGWINAVTGLGNETWTVKDVVVGAFRIFGSAGALAWDTIKAGAGAVLIVLGLFVSALSYVTDAFNGLVQLAKKLPDSIKPSWVDKFADHTARASKLVEGTGRTLRKWGTDAVNGFGNSAAKFNVWLDGVANKTKEQAKAAAQEAVAAADQVGAVLKKFDNAALIKGSSAEVSARLKHEFSGKNAQERLLEEQKKANKELKDINGGVKALNKKPAGQLQAV